MKSLIIFPNELDINGNIFESLDKFFEYTYIHRKIIEDEFD